MVKVYIILKQTPHKKYTYFSYTSTWTTPFSLNTSSSFYITLLNYTHKHTIDINYTLTVTIHYRRRHYHHTISTLQNSLFSCSPLSFLFFFTSSRSNQTQLPNWYTHTRYHIITSPRTNNEETIALQIAMHMMRYQNIILLCAECTDAKC